MCLLPALHTVTEVVGGVTDVAAEVTGLRAGTPVIAGTGDTFPTLVGCGAVDACDAMISLGTTGLLTLTTHRLESAAAGPHFVAASADDTRSTEEEGAVLWAANVLACGQLLAWLRKCWDRLCGCRRATRSTTVRSTGQRSPCQRAANA